MIYPLFIADTPILSLQPSCPLRHKLTRICHNMLTPDVHKKISLITGAWNVVYYYDSLPILDGSYDIRFTEIMLNIYTGCPWTL